MPLPAIGFTTDERNCFLESFPEWEELQGVGKLMDDDGLYYSPKNRLIDEAIQRFFERFPDRDISRRPNSTTVVKNLYYNQVTQRRSPNERIALESNKHVNVVTVYKQQYRDAIIARKEELMQREGVDAMSAYNQATKEGFESLRIEDPDRFKELNALAASIRANGKKPFSEQEPEVQQAILGNLGAEIVTVLKNWERRSEARIFTVAVWANPKGGPSVFDYATKNCGDFAKSDACRTMRDLFETYMNNNQAATLYNDPTHAKPCVYPNDIGWPHLPDPEIEQMDADTKKRLIRRYMVLTSEALGGIAPSYAEMARRHEAGLHALVPQARLPEGITHLSDLSGWRVQTLALWTSHLLASQRQLIDIDRRFYWESVFTRGATRVTPVHQIRFEPVPGAKVRWTAEETLYGERVRLSGASTQSVTPDWKGLPLARMSHIYPPYTVELVSALREIHKGCPALLDLVAETARMESLGPIHNTAGFSDIPDRDNPHVPSSRSRSLARSLQPAAWLPCVFFDPMHPDHVLWSILTLKHWIMKQQPHIHHSSETVFGGPSGVRTIVFALSRIIQICERVLNSNDIPVDIARVATGPSRLWSAEETLRTANECVDIVRRDVARARSIMGLTYAARSSQWKNEVRAECMRLESNMPADPHTQAMETGISATSGVPKSHMTLISMKRALDVQTEASKYDDPMEEAMLHQAFRLDESVRASALHLDTDSETDEEIRKGLQQIEASESTSQSATDSDSETTGTSPRVEPSSGVSTATPGNTNLPAAADSNEKPSTRVGRPPGKAVVSRRRSQRIAKQSGEGQLQTRNKRYTRPDAM